MNTESVDCRRVASVADCKTPGDFFFEPSLVDNQRWLYVLLPGEEHADPIKVNCGPALGYRVWGWDGNEDRPTVEPSINYEGRWHGYLRNGRLESC